MAMGYPSPVANSLLGPLPRRLHGHCGASVVTAGDAVANRMENPDETHRYPTAKVLGGFTRRGKLPDQRLKAATVLVREYQGERHTITVVPGGYECRENIYASLSTIARAIPATAWKGPRFFGLRTRRD